MLNDTFNKSELLRTGGTVILGNTAGDEWRRVNEASLSEYRDHHQSENYPPASLAVMAMFEGFIAKWAKKWGADSLIDLGCGIGSKVPPYVRSLSDVIPYAGLDPFEENMDREYAFIAGRLEDLAEMNMTSKFGLAIFATSLDHFENAHDALKLTPSVVEGGRAIIWCGVHDSAHVAANYAMTRISEICRQHQSIMSRTLAFITYALATWPRIVLTLAKRERNLKAGRPLDKLHFHYFTEAKLLALLSEVGTVHEFARCPGTNSIFAAVTIPPNAD